MHSFSWRLTIRFTICELKQKNIDQFGLVAQQSQQSLEKLCDLTTFITTGLQLQDCIYWFCRQDPQHPQDRQHPQDPQHLQHPVSQRSENAFQMSFVLNLSHNNFL
eukprot:212473_1